MTYEERGTLWCQLWRTTNLFMSEYWTCMLYLFVFLRAISEQHTGFVHVVIKNPLKRWHITFDHILHLKTTTHKFNQLIITPGPVLKTYKNAHFQSINIDWVTQGVGETLQLCFPCFLLETNIVKYSHKLVLLHCNPVCIAFIRCTVEVLL